MPQTSIRSLLLLVLFLAAFVSDGDVAAHPAGFVITGRWAGPAFANPLFDFNEDGIAGRTFDVRAYDELPFSGIEGALDSIVIGFGCAGPGSVLLRPLGKVLFRGRFGDSLYADIDTTAPDLCFDPANPAEHLRLVFSGGTGIYAHASGSADLVIRDQVLLTKSVTVPGLPPDLPAPVLIDTQGDFVLSIRP